jgi:AraC-like DNA-binding protein
MAIPVSTACRPGTARTVAVIPAATTVSTATVPVMIPASARRAVIDVRATELARQYLTAHAPEPVSAAILEKITGTDRFTLTRHFRRAYGTSPNQYRTRRRLDLARAAIERGTPLAQAAIEAGFADQSHMTRQFKQAYGLTPARWANAVRFGEAGQPMAPEPC